MGKGCWQAILKQKHSESGKGLTSRLPPGLHYEITLPQGPFSFSKVTAGI